MDSRSAAFAGPVAPRCRRPLRWLVLVVLLVVIGVGLCLRKIRAGSSPTSFPCELKLGSDEFAGLTIVGDLHGDYPALLELLRHAGLIPPAQGNETALSLENVVKAARDGNDLPAAAVCSRWLGARGHTLVQLGDNVDRGPGAAAVVACLRACQNAARAVGGKVIRLVGNHELMWFQSAFRYAHDIDDPPHARNRMVANWTDEVLSGRVMGAWASGSMLFVHAGLRPAMLDRLMLHRSALNDDASFVSLSNASLASRVAGQISFALAAAVANCASANETTMFTRRRCLKLSDQDELFSAGPDRGGRGLGGPFWTDWSVLNRAEPTSFMMDDAGNYQGDQWVWPPVKLKRRGDGAIILEPSESNTFVQIVGHTPARCNVREDEWCEPIRARSDLAAVVADAGIADYYGGNRAYITVPAEEDLVTSSTKRSHRGRRIVSVIRDPAGGWRRHDLMAALCGGEVHAGVGSRVTSNGKKLSTKNGGRKPDVDSEVISGAIPLGPG